MLCATVDALIQIPTIIKIECIGMKTEILLIAFLASDRVGPAIDVDRRP